jgi:D-3-phosphoglycerate dehydrogenase / 2-oxoglutarate reductase
MFQIRTYNAISPSGLSRFDLNRYVVSAEMAQPHAILIRSHKLDAADLPETVLAVARAGAGTNNVPTSALTRRGVVVFNTPGANANAVKELICAGLMMASRDIYAGMQYIETLKEMPADRIDPLLEAEKKRFAGVEIGGKTLGIVGLGAIGSLVANMALDLGMRVIGFDPAISVEAAWRLSSRVEKMPNLDSLLRESDYITLHVPAIDATKEMINEESISRMKQGAKLLNFARKEIVHSMEVAKALDSGRLGCYVTDFPTLEFIGHPKAILMPHIGASTVEAEDNCAVMAANQLVDFLENGNIVNSVNFPNTTMARSAGYRLTVANKNVPNVLSSVLAAISATGSNVIDLVNQSRGDVAYNIIDIDRAMSSELFASIGQIDGVIVVRGV